MKYYLFDAKGKILGRLSTEIAVVLRGKNNPNFAKNNPGECSAVVINSDKVRLSGTKSQKKIYHRYSGFPGGITSKIFADQMKTDSTEVVKRAVYGMLPKNKLRKIFMKRLYVYKDEKHNQKIDHSLL